MKIQFSKKCEGYIWYSDQPEPQIIGAEVYVLELDNNKNPFVVEGQIYSESEQKSVSIKYVDGKYIVKKYDLREIVGKVCNEKSFIPQRLGGVAKIKFRQYWKEQEDEFCEGMKTLVPAECVFMGFSNHQI
ncbi:MAG: TIGR04423 family type III CRISPR-associated protein [Bacteroidales bacterium]|jgi:CRISPR type III-associated protein (TIGR04423 family)|nr:TIGR04423 family type III CRISPR-associated protein [Bacteroidales bacterium]